MKKINITYNPKGLSRIENAMSKIVLPPEDINPQNINIKKDQSHYWVIESKTKK